jgi:CO/xanthine dehydrogenase Mo-binding subunit
LGAAGAAGLVIGFYLPGRFEALAAARGVGAVASLNAWMRISPDDTVTIMIDKSEMGQGILTALCMLAAEELECDWKKIRTEFAPAAPEYFNPAFGVQGTGGSSSVRSSWDPMRKAGAAARDMLLQAAAAEMGRGQIHVPCGKRRDPFHDATKTKRDVRQSGHGSVETSRSSKGCPLKDPKQYRDRKANQAAGHAFQSRWPRGIWNRRAAAGNAVRRGGALPGVRREGREL